MGLCTGLGSSRSRESQVDPAARSHETRSAILVPVSRIWVVSRRWESLRVAGSALGLAWLVMVAAYAFGGFQSGVTLAGVVTAVSAVVIAGTGLLYAFRLGAGGLVD